MGSKKHERQPTSRTQMDAVTGKLVTTELDEVQKAFERVKQVTDAKMLDMDAAERFRLAAMIRDMAIGMLPRTGG